jgi:hypothetical protein
VRRVPGVFAGVDRRGLVIQSTGIRVADDPRGHAARDKVGKLDTELFRFWEALKAGKDPEADGRYQEAVAAARQAGVAYIPAKEVARLPAAELVRRVETVDDGGRVERPKVVSAVLGGEQVPPLMLSGLREVFERINATALAAKSERQLRRWRVQRDAAVETFTAVLGVIGRCPT